MRRNQCKLSLRVGELISTFVAVEIVQPVICASILLYEYTP